MSWQAYADNLVANDFIDGAAIWGCNSGEEGQWAIAGDFKDITADEIKKIVKDRSGFFAQGCYLGGVKCRVLREELDQEDSHSMVMKTMPDSQGNKYDVCISRSCQTLIIAKGKKDGCCGQVRKAVYDMMIYLRKSNF